MPIAMCYSDHIVAPVDNAEIRVGQQRGQWTVLGPVFWTRRKREKPRYVVCQCTCGTISAVHVRNRNKLASKCCGCTKPKPTVNQLWRKCNWCCKVAHIDEFYKTPTKKYPHRRSNICKACYRERQRNKWQHIRTKTLVGRAAAYRLNPDKAKSQDRKHREQLRHRVLEHYSKGTFQCACCGDAHLIFLCLDHVAGGGNIHRAQVTGKRTGSVYPWIVKNGFPDGFRVLCFNCNYAFARLGFCPHHPPREVIVQNGLEVN
jgi:hypothetical protein